MRSASRPVSPHGRQISRRLHVEQRVWPFDALAVVEVLGWWVTGWRAMTVCMEASPGSMRLRGTRAGREQRFFDFFEFGRFIEDAVRARLEEGFAVLGVGMV